MAAGLDCVTFLQTVLPRMGYRWRGFRNVRGQVCKRITARLRELGLTGFDEYLQFLAAHDGEWAILDGLCGVTISRFYRDRAVFDVLRDEALPALARAALRQGPTEIACASLGCASRGGSLGWIVEPGAGGMLLRRPEQGARQPSA